MRPVEITAALAVPRTEGFFRLGWIVARRVTGAMHGWALDNSPDALGNGERSTLARGAGGSGWICPVHAGPHSEGWEETPPRLGK